MAAYKRKIYLINPKFQIKFSLLVCILILVSSMVYPVIIYDIYDNFISYISKQVPEFSEPLMKSFSQKKLTLIAILGLWQIGFASIVFIACIIFSHKIAGPIYKLQMFLRKIRDGESPSKLSFRKGDYFLEIADDFNDAIHSLSTQYQKDFAYISEVNTYINNLTVSVPDDKKIVLNEINRKLAEIQKRFDTY